MIKAAGIDTKFLTDIAGCLRARAISNVIGDGECGIKRQQKLSNNRNLFHDKFLILVIHDKIQKALNL